MSWGVVFRVNAAFGNPEYLIGKGGGGATPRGFNTFLHASNKIRIDYLGSRIDYEPPDVSEWIGRTFIVLATVNSMSLDLYVWHDGLQRAFLIDTLASPATPTSDDRTFALGAQRGDIGANETNNASIVGAVVGGQKLTQAGATAWMAACIAEGRVASMPGEISRWNADNPGGLQVDEVGSVDLTPNFGAGPLTYDTYQPTYHGGLINVLHLDGQSNGEGQDLIVNWSTSPINYQATDSTIQFLNDSGAAGWRDLGPVADGDAGPELSAGRALAGVWGGETRVVKYCVGGTSLAVDWSSAGAGGPQWNAFVAQWATAQTTLPDPLYTLRPRKAFWIQGERDAEVLAWATAYGGNLRAHLDAMRGALAPLHPEFRFVVFTLPSFMQQAYKDDVNAAIVDVANTRGDVSLVDTRVESVDHIGDFLHYDAPSLELLGALGAAA